MILAIIQKRLTQKGYIIKNYKTYSILILLLNFTACSPTSNEVSNCASDGAGGEQFNPNKHVIKPCTREYVPVCGEVQIECITTPCEPLKQTFPNACVLGNNKNATFLYKGKCK